MFTHISLWGSLILFLEPIFVWKGCRFTLWHTNCMEGLSFLGSPKVFFAQLFFLCWIISCSCRGDMITLCRYVTLSFASALCGGWDVIPFRFTCKCIMWVEELLVCLRFPLNFFILFCLFAPFNSWCSTIKACIEWQHVSILRIPCRRSVGVCGGLCIAYPCSLGKCF